MAAGLWREVGDDKSDNHPAEDGNQNDECAPRARRREKVRVIRDLEPPEECNIVQKSDQRAKQDRADPGDQAHDHPEDRQSGEPDALWQLESHLLCA